MLKVDLFLSLCRTILEGLITRARKTPQNFGMNVFSRNFTLWSYCIVGDLSTSSYPRPCFPSFTWPRYRAHSYLRNEKKTGSSSPSQRLLGVLLGTGKNRPIADQRGLCNDPRNNWGRIWAAVAFVVSKVAYSRLRVWLFGRIQDYILDVRFFGFITTKETKIRKWILQCDSNSGWSIPLYNNNDTLF